MPRHVLFHDVIAPIRRAIAHDDPLSREHRLIGHGLQRQFNELRFVSRRRDDNVFETLGHAYCH